MTAPLLKHVAVKTLSTYQENIAWIKSSWYYSRNIEGTFVIMSPSPNMGGVSPLSHRDRRPCNMPKCGRHSLKATRNKFRILNSCIKFIFNAVLWCNPVWIKTGEWNLYFPVALIHNATEIDRGRITVIGETICRAAPCTRILTLLEYEIRVMENVNNKNNNKIWVHKLPIELRTKIIIIGSVW